jgi:hypothetical protein
VRRPRQQIAAALASLLAVGGMTAWTLSTQSSAGLRSALTVSQFWVLYAHFSLLIASTAGAVREFTLPWRTIRMACMFGVVAALLSAALPPRTSRIYYDEQIYQGVARNLSDLHRAQMCNDGNVEYGRLQCSRGEYNKEPYGYPFLLSILYSVGGVNEAAAYRLNNVMFGATVVAVILLAELLFADVLVSLFSGITVMLLPTHLSWSNTAAAEPGAALFCAVSVLAAVHFCRVRTRAALAWLVVVATFTMTLRPECMLIVIVIAVAVSALAASELATPRVWWGCAAAAVLAVVPVAHAVAVRQEPWGAAGSPWGWHYAAANAPVNFWFYFFDERFPSLVGIAAVVGAVAGGRGRERAVLATYFLTFWAVFLFFYAGSYNYGADVRFSLMSSVPISILGGLGLARGAAIIRWLPGRRELSTRRAAAIVVVVLLLNFVCYLTLVRSTGEEAWAARTDVRMARVFSDTLAPNSIVLTHNPSMFHIWGVSAAQLSIAASDAAYIDRMVRERYAGGAYVHWNYWCNTASAQRAFCQGVLDRFPHTRVASYRERDFEYALYRITGPAAKPR